MIIEMVGLLFYSEWIENKPEECVRTRLLLGCGEVQLPGAFPVSPFESVIVVDFKNDS